MTRSLSFKPASDATGTVLGIATDLLNRWWSEHSGTAVRLLGISLGTLVAADQLDLFKATTGTAVRDTPFEPARRESATLDPTLDKIRKKFGVDSVKRASSLGKEDKPDGFKDVRRR